MMQRKFQDGEDAARRTDRTRRITVISYTGYGKVICRWMNKGEVMSEEFVEAELETWVRRPPRKVYRA